VSGYCSWHPPPLPTVGRSDSPKLYVCDIGCTVSGLINFERLKSFEYGQHLVLSATCVVLALRHLLFAAVSNTFS